MVERVAPVADALQTLIPYIDSSERTSSIAVGVLDGLNRRKIDEDTEKGVLLATMLAGLVAYQEVPTSYWPKFAESVGQADLPNSPNSAREIVEDVIRKSRMHQAKLSRLARTYDSGFPDVFWNVGPGRHGLESADLWNQLWGRLRERPYQRSIILAFKALDIALLVLGGKRAKMPKDIPIATDAQTSTIAARSGMIAFESEPRIGWLVSKHPAIVEEAWEGVLARLRSLGPKLSGFEFDIILDSIGRAYQKEELERYLESIAVPERDRSLVVAEFFRVPIRRPNAARQR